MKEAKVLQGLTAIHDIFVLQRLEGVARSPVFSQLSTSLQGLTSIRAFSAQNMLRSQVPQFVECV
jgi:hypothetical protein